MRDDNILSGVALALSFAVASCNGAPTEEAPPDPVKHGEYLVTVMGCGDCHTPGYFFGKPDTARALAGSDVSFFMPGMGYFYPPNLTPDATTGLGTWTEAQIVDALRTGKRPDGRILAPIMPWMNFARLTDQDANAIAVYLKSLAPVTNQVPQITAPDQTPPGPVMAVVAPPGLTPVGLPPAVPPVAETPPGGTPPAPAAPVP